MNYLVDHGGSPPKKEVSNDDKRWIAAVNEVGEKGPEGGFEGGGGLEEAEDEVVGEVVGVLAGRREAVVGGVEGDFEEADGGDRGESSPEVFDVERGVYEGYLITLLFNL